MTEDAAWRRRFRAATLSLPTWARDAPDRCLLVSNEGGRTQELYAWDHAAGTRRQVTDRPAGTTVGALEPDGRAIWWFDDDRGSEHGTWVVQPFDGGEARPAAPGLEPGYASGLVLGTRFAIAGVSNDGGSGIWLCEPGSPPQRLYGHREASGVASLSRDERLVAMWHAEAGDSRHPALRVLDRRGRAVADLADGPGCGLEAGPWSPVPGDQRLVVVHERTGRSRPAIWVPESGALTELPMDLPGDVDAEWYPDASALLLRHDDGGCSELYRYDLAERRPTRLTTRPGSIVAAVVRPDGHVWYHHSSGATAPRLVDDRQVLLEPEGPLAPPGVPYQDLTVGDVRGFLVEPVGSRPHPTVVLVHGGPHSHDRDAWSPRVQTWVDHGFAVALVNYRGSSGHGRAWRDAMEGNPGFTELEDVRAVRDHVVAAGIADPRRLVLAGASWGGYLTLLGLGRQQDAWTLGVALVPVADYVAAYEDEMEPLRAFDRALFGGTPTERPEFYEERSPITYADRLRAPVLVVAGVNDPRCPIRQIQRYVARLRELRKPHEYYEYEAGHSAMVVDEQIRQLEVQLAFVHRHLGTPPPL